MVEMLWGSIQLGISIVTFALTVAGGYFVFSGIAIMVNPAPTGVDPALLGLQRLENLSGTGGGIATGTALLLGALVLLVFQVGMGLYRRLDRQNSYLRYLAERARKDA